MGNYRHHENSNCFVLFPSVACTPNKYVINLGCLIPYLFLSRLTPPLAAIILLQVSLIEHLGSGPMWDKTNYALTQMCKDNWWLALLYVQNYFSGHRMVRKLGVKCVTYETMILNQRYLYIMAV